MRVRVKFFARYREVVGKADLEIEVEEGATLAHLQQKIGQQFPSIKEYTPYTLLTVNGEYAVPHFSLSEGDEVAFLPPLSGGEHD